MKKIVGRLIITSLVIFAWGCSESITKENIHVVPALAPINKDEYPMQRPPILIYNFSSNFIVDSTGQLFFFKQPQIGMTCGMGNDEDLPPKYLGIKPIDIIQVPEAGLADFIKFNVTPNWRGHINVSIGSLKDTVESKGLTIIFKTIKEKYDKPVVFFRKATLEERVVLSYKQNRKAYYPDSIDWDSTQIRFDELP